MLELERQNSYLQETLGKLSLILGAIHESIIWTDTNGAIEWCNDSFLTLCSTQRMDILGKSFTEVITLYEPDAIQLLPKYKYPTLLASQEKKHITATYACKNNGKTIFIEVATYYTLSIGKSYLIILIQDITEKLLNERNLVELNNSLENAQMIARLGSWTLDSTTNEISSSKELRIIMGLKDADHAPDYLSFLQAVHPNDRDILAKEIKQGLVNGDKFSLEVRILAADNTYRWIHLACGARSKSDAPFKTLSGTAMDITTRKNNENEILELSQKLVVYAREKGRADVASSILHEVGNILSSLNISSKLLIENFDQKYFDDFFRVCSLLRKNADNIANYLSQDEKGKLIPAYLVELSKTILYHYSSVREEMENIDANIQHIGNVISAQELFITANQFVEKVHPKEVIESILKMMSVQLSTSRILVIEEYEDIPMIYVDRVKMVEILVNLFTNAIQALNENTGNHKKEIRVSAKKMSKKTLKISIADNGVGIDKDNLNKIFTYGYSTKKGGHGIGLHGGSIAAKEMGGSLTVSSDGVGCGALFVLELPLDKPLTGKKP